MNHEAALAQLEAYLDGELDRATVDEVETHLATCAACRAELATLEQLRSALRALPKPRAPADLRARLSASDEMRAMEKPRRIFGQNTLWRMAAAVLLGVALGAGVMQWRGRGGGELDPAHLLVRDLLTSHLRALAANSAIDVVSEDRHTVKPWFAGKIGESPPVIDPKAADFPLLGGRIDYVGARRTAVVVYGHRKHIIDVFIAPGADGAGVRATQSQGYALTPCVLEATSAWIVSDIDAESLRRFAELLGCSH